MPTLAQVGFGPYPQDMTCPYCSARITTTTKAVPGVLTYVACFACFFVGVCALGCCLIPFCVDGLQDIEHHCPNCSRHLGTCKRL